MLQRHLSLDALRGFAVMGILLMNIIGFSMPDAAYLNPRAWGGMSGPDLSIWAANFILVDAKFRTLFSILFGASMLLFIDRAEASGRDAEALHFRRMGWLLVFGLLHYALIWYGDILSMYAVIGMIAWRWRGLEAPKQMKRAVLLIGASVLMWGAIMGGVAAFDHRAQRPGASATEVKEMQEVRSSFGAPDAFTLEKDLALHRGSYGGLVYDRAVNDMNGPFILVLLYGVETLGLMALGMALLRNRFLTGKWERARYWRVVIAGYGLGLPLMGGLALWCWLSDFDALVTGYATLFWSIPLRVPIAVAHAALALIAIQRFANSPLVGRVAAAGQAAFTNYIGSSLIMTLIFYGYGLGQYGHISRTGVYGFVVLAWVLMLLWSKPWMDRYTHGPLEWAWRSLVQGSRVPLRRK